METETRVAEDCSCTHGVEEYPNESDIEDCNHACPVENHSKEMYGSDDEEDDLSGLEEYKPGFKAPLPKKWIGYRGFIKGVDEDRLVFLENNDEEDEPSLTLVNEFAPKIQKISTVDQSDYMGTDYTPDILDAYIVFLDKLESKDVDKDGSVEIADFSVEEFCLYKELPQEIIDDYLKACEHWESEDLLTLNDFLGFTGNRELDMCAIQAYISGLRVTQMETVPSTLEID